jgi:acetyltransferase-like isoleucine patch superfamily enzyme
MSQSFHILGHSNATLSLILDTLLTLFPTEDLQVTIVCNMPVEEGIPYAFDGVSNLTLREINGLDWGGEYNHLMMGVNQVKTKGLVYRHFNESHGVIESNYYTLLHPSVLVGRKTRLERGVLVGPGSVIGPYASVGNLATMHARVSVGHHARVGKFCTLNAGCNVGACCVIGDSTTVGMGANIIDRVTIGKNVIVGAGALVAESLPDNVIAWGVPARIVG